MSERASLGFSVLGTKPTVKSVLKDQVGVKPTAGDNVPLALWDRSLPVAPLSNLLVLVTLVLGLSELAGVRVVGALLLILTSGVASACCALLALTTLAALVFGVLVGAVGSAFGTTDLQQFFEQQFGIHVDVTD